MLNKILFGCAALAAFGLAIERPTSEVQARHRRCCGYSHRCHSGCGYQNYNGNCCGGNSFAYAQPVQGGCSQGCSSQGCSAQGCGQGGCSVQSGQVPTTYSAGYGPTEAGADVYGNQPGFQNAPPPMPERTRTTFERDATIDANTNVRSNVTVPTPAIPPAPAASAGAAGANVNTAPDRPTVTLPPAAPAAPAASINGNR